MQRGVEVFSRLEHPERHMNKFAHHRPNNELGRLTRIARHIEAVVLLGAHDLQRIQPQHHRPQGLFAGRRGLPRPGTAFRTKPAINLASTLSVLLRARCDPPNALIWAGLTTLTVISSFAR